MASRQEEKEQRRRERLVKEQEERRAIARRARLRVVTVAVVAVGVIAGAVFAIGASGGDDEEPAAGVSEPKVALPEQTETDLKTAVRTAGCKLVNAESEGQGHEDRAFTAADYRTNPPNSGTHAPVPAQDGTYAPGNPPELGSSVHALEHGRVLVQHEPGATEQEVDQLESFVAENGGYHMLLFENQTEMKAKVAATAWTQVLTCPTVSDATWDALRTFRDRYVDQAPEKVP